MCIVFIYNGVNETESDYSLILISNRDEHFERPAQCMAPWNEDSNVYGGKDLEPGCEGGTWMAVSPTRGKLGLLLNLPGVKKESAKSRGRIVSDYMKSTMPLSEYVEFIHNYSMQCNVFLFLSVDFGAGQFLYSKSFTPSTPTPKIKTYSNATDNIYQWPDTYLGFSNSLPDKPLKKVEAGKNYLTDICGRLNKIMDKSQLIDELTCLLKNKERAHTIMLLSKSGHMDLIEISMQSPIDPEKPHWEKSAFQFDLIK
ncbi:transport and Golgi organization protein 2 isoform X4 [Pararge aegeria]|uniref:transport and Golgi organization protein 2 isoform X4 n=1 Tax=Pararge aegeria TaxID=116150 RepID=UPI0019D02C0C|nr:transport and Golgi organization protein 2 isoform X4 [Pararge aegeria]